MDSDDVGMKQSCRGVCLALEAPSVGGIIGQVARQDLERVITGQPRMAS
jgi:hypothetical protein